MLSSPWGEMTCDSLAGLCRRVDSLLAAVLQRCKNHDTFEVVRVSVDESGLTSLIASGSTPCPHCSSSKNARSELASSSHAARLN
jgi:hypothetical protein